MHRFGIRRLGAMLSVALVLGLLVAGFSVVQAQQDDPTVDGPGTPRPGHIHSGTCVGGGLGDVVYALNNATIDNLSEDASTSDVDFAGSEDVNPVYVSETTIEDVTLDDLLADDYAINFHLSGDEIDTYIACGEIGGFARDGVLYVGLVPVAEFPDVQFAGSAILTDNGDDTVTVVVQIVELPIADASTAPASVSTPVSTPIVTVPDESVAPSAAASVEESAAPSAVESVEPSASASVEQSAVPSASASVEQSAAPSAAASAEETAVPSASDEA